MDQKTGVKYTTMTYQQMVDALMNMDEQQRRLAIQAHWEIIFSDSFIAYMQGQLEEGRKIADGGPGIEKLYAGLTSDLGDILRKHVAQHLTQLLQVWNCMVSVYEKLQKQSEGQGNSQGMVNHGKHRVMPRGVAITNAIHCYRCGSQVADQGLCSGCLSTQQSWEQEDLEYDRQLHDQQQQQVEYQRFQDDQIYHQQQQDFNTYTNYYNDY